MRGVVMLETWILTFNNSHIKFSCKMVYFKQLYTYGFDKNMKYFSLLRNTKEKLFLQFSCVHVNVLNSFNNCTTQEEKKKFAASLTAFKLKHQSRSDFPDENGCPPAPR